LYYNTSLASCSFSSIVDIAVGDIAANAITPIKMGTRTLVALADSAATPTIAQLMTSSVFTMTPGAARNFTTPTAALMVAGVTGATVGSWFDFTIVNAGNFPITVVAGDAGVTLTGSAVVNKGAATYRAVLTNVTGAAEALTIYRTDSAVITEQIPVTNGSVLIGDANGLASIATPDTAGLVTKANAQTIAGVKSFSAPIVYDANTTITAFSGGGQGSAVALTGEFNNITTVAAGYDSVKLPAAVLGQTVTVKNSGGNILSVFPATDDAINALAANLSVDIPVGGELTFRAIDGTTYETNEVLTSQAPSTQKGNLSVKAADNAANHAVTVTNASHGQATVHTIPDPGGATASFVLTEGTQTINGAKTLTGALTAEANAVVGKAGTIAGQTSHVAPTAGNGNLIVKAVNAGGAFDTTISNGTMGQSSVVTIPDPGAGTANFVLDAGTQTVGGVKTFSSAIKTAADVGTASTGVAAAEYGDGAIHKTVLTLTLTGDNDIDIADSADKTKGTKLYDFPAGYVRILGATCDLSNTTNAAYNATAADQYFIGIGTADGTQAANADLTGTEQDIIAKTTHDTDSGAGANTQLTNTLKAAMATDAAFDGTSTAVALWLNIATPDANTSAPTTHAVTGTVTVVWVNLGDF
jgi:hypothetical protein